MLTCDLQSAIPAARFDNREPGALEDMYMDIDSAEPQMANPRGIERCVQTDLFLQDMVQEHGAVRLSRNEYRFLSVLVRSEGKTLTASDLMATVFGVERKRSSHYVRMYISLMRRRLERDPRNPRHIITEHRRGYRFVRRQWAARALLARHHLQRAL